MPWDLTIRSVTGDLGSLDKVQAAISHVFPSVRFGCAPSGMEKIRAAAERGIEFPDVIRDFMVSQPARHIGELETDGISLQFQLGPVDLVQEVGVEVRGTGDPFPLLR